MKLADLFQRLHAACLILAGRVALPDVPPSKLEVAMAFEKTKASVAQLEDALTRAKANDAAKDAALAAANSDKAALQTALDDADNEIVAELQPAVDQALALAPAPTEQPQG